MRHRKPRPIALGALGFALWLGAVGAKQLLEARLVTHVLGLVPLLVAAGVLLAPDPPPRRLEPWNRGGASGLAFAFLIVGFWMLPRAIDASLFELGYAVGKFVSLPAAGVALAWSLPYTPGLVRAFLFAQLLAMSGALGWLYLAYPDRLCLGYRASEQAVLGGAWLLLATSGVVAALVWALRGRPSGVPADRASRCRLLGFPA